MDHYDNLHHTLNIGDLVMCLTSTEAYKLHTVVRLGTRKNLPFDDLSTVTLENKKTFVAENVLSLVALGINNISTGSADAEKCDALGHKVCIGDKVLFLHSMESQVQTGIVIKMTEATCLIEIPRNRFNQTEYRQKYQQVVDLTAAGVGYIPNISIVYHWND